MAEERETSQTVEKPATPAPPEPDIDSLLTTLPELKGLFDGTPKDEVGKTEPPKGEAVTEPAAPETAPTESLENLIPEGLKPEEEKPQEEAKKDDGVSEKVQKRIDELTAKRKSAEERASALEAELTDLKAKFQAPAPVAPSPENPLADIETEADLSKRFNLIQEAKAWCFKHLDGGEVPDGQGGKKWVDGNAVKGYLADAEMMLSTYIPARKEFIAAKKVFDSEAKREYPALFKEGTQPHKVYNQWCTLFPECRRYPDIALIVGDALVGQKIREDRAKNRNGQLPASAQKPLSTPAPAASPKVPQSRALSGAALQTAFQENPEGALNSFVDSLIEGAAAQRIASR